MKILRKLSEEKGSITMTVVAAMLFITGAIIIAYFSLSNQSNDQSKKIRQIADSYKVTNSDLVQKYKDVQDNLNDITTMSITQTKALGNYMFAKGTNTTVTDESGNKFVVPAGFKVTDDANSVTEGMVIQDKDENEFVWIPVGIPWKSDPSKTITLSRYTFDENGIPTDQGTNTIDNYYTELDNSSYGNAVAKNINDFISKTNAAGGFWIGRFEARVESWTGNVVTGNSNNNPNWTGYTGGKLVEKPGAQVFNYITQIKASELSRNMYSTNYFFESDLINSYAWDTATLFLQEYDNRTYNLNTNSNYKTKYSRQNILSSGLKNTGTNASTIAEANKDKICNVYDMAENCMEYTTETCNDGTRPCVVRGSICTSNSSSTNIRAISKNTASSRLRFLPPYTVYKVVLKFVKIKMDLFPLLK